MGVSLAKSQKVSLTKSGGGGGLSRVFMGLGWDPVKKGGFFGFGGGGGDIDLDASCIMFDDQKNVVDTVWFRQLKSTDGSIVHSGDNLTGDGDGDDEVINVDLSRVRPNVTSLVFVIASFRGQTFNEVESAFCRLVDSDTKSEVARYNLSGKNSSTAQVMARVYKDNGVWTMQALGEAANGRTAQDLADVAKRFA